MLEGWLGHGVLLDDEAVDSALEVCLVSQQLGHKVHGLAHALQTELLLSKGYRLLPDVEVVVPELFEGVLDLGVNELGELLLLLLLLVLLELVGVLVHELVQLLLNYVISLRGVVEQFV